MKALYSDRTKRDFLRRFTQAAESDAAQGTPILIGQLVNRANTLNSNFTTQLTTTQSAFSRRRAKVAQRMARVEELARACRDFWAGLRRRAARTGKTDWQESRYKLHSSKPLTQLSKFTEWITAAQELLAGEAEAQAAGEAPMANPSGEELTAFLTAAQAAEQELTEAQRLLNTERATLDQTRAAINTLHREGARYLRYSLGELPAPNRRQQMREYGYVFLSSQSQQGGVEPEPDPEEEQPSEGEDQGDTQTGSETGTETGSESETDPETESQQEPDPETETTTTP